MDEIADGDVDAMTFEPNVGADRLVRGTGVPAHPLNLLFGYQGWPHLRYWLRCLSQDSGGAFDQAGFAFDTDERWPGDEEFTGVKVFAPWDEEHVVSRAAFARLMRRFYGAVVAAAVARRDPAMRA